MVQCVDSRLRLYCLVILANNDSASNTEKSAMWFYIQDREKKLEDVHTEHAIPICALAPTVPRTLVPNSGWNSLPQQEVV
jgi:hypothetical protein